MAHDLDMTNGRANIAYLGSRKDVWHHLGQETPEGAGLDKLLSKLSQMKTEAA